MMTTPDPAPDISIILCTRNGSATIRTMLDSLGRQQTDVRWELLVVDNGSTDGTWEVLSEYLDALPMQRVRADERAGLGYARNRGVEHSGAPLIAFVDDDDELDRGWISALFAELQRSELVGSRFEYERLSEPGVMTGRSQFQSEGTESMFGYAIVSGGGLGCHRRIWDEVGGNDESLNATGEDTDFAIRVQRDLGVEPGFARAAIYHYRQRGGARSSFRQGRRYGAAHVMLYSRHGRGRIDRRVESQRAFRDWWWILSRSPFAWLPDRRVPWARRSGLRLGRLIGSIRHRTIYP